MRKDKSKAKSNKICLLEASFSRKLNSNMFSQVSALHAYNKLPNLFFSETKRLVEKLYCTFFIYYHTYSCYPLSII